MIRDIRSFVNQKFDVLVIGGGINGAAIANLAAACGASVALLEQNDFGSGTSSKTTKLLHGGIRYLENFEFDLVRESLKERYIQWQAAPHLVKPLPFVIPVYAHEGRPLWMMRVGVWLYDLLSGKYRFGQHRALTVDEVIAYAPGINQEGLVGGVEYVDAQMDDARICLENVLMADKRGARVANYVRVEKFIKMDGRAIGVNARDMLSGDPLDVFAHKIIVAAGPWSDGIIHQDVPRTMQRLRLTKGVHVVVEGKLCDRAFLLQTRGDKRVFFMIPFKGNSLIGTTDTDYVGDVDAVSVDDQDIQYLLDEAARFFPHTPLDRSNIITSFAGLRPLVADKGQTSKISRKHVIEHTYADVYYVMGGKYTTYRLVAEETIKKALPQLAVHLPYSRQYTLYGSGGVNEESKILAHRFGISLELVRHLSGVYGGKIMDVLHILSRDPLMKEKICSCSPTICAQIVYAREVEMAYNIEDIAQRRLGLSYLECPTHRCLRAIEDILKNHS